MHDQVAWNCLSSRYFFNFLDQVPIHFPLIPTTTLCQLNWTGNWPIINRSILKKSKQVALDVSNLIRALLVEHATFNLIQETWIDLYFLDQLLSSEHFIFNFLIKSLDQGSWSRNLPVWQRLKSILISSVFLYTLLLFNLALRKSVTLGIYFKKFIINNKNWMNYLNIPWINYAFIYHKY